MLPGTTEQLHRMEPALTTAHTPTRIYYVDDSGDARSLAVIGWLGIELTHWQLALDSWHHFRRSLHTDPDLDIRADDELHAVNLAAGRGRRLNDAVRTRGEVQKSRYRDVVRRGLETVAKMPGATAGAAFRRTRDIGRDRVGLYAAWIERLNAQHAASNSHALVVVDGDGTEHALRRAHRALQGGARHVIEDPFFVPAHGNHLVQAADLIVHAAFQHLARQPNREPLWEWFPEILLDAGPPVSL
ncbi:DUF3800 domain-containing protein [Streptomyces platensis]|uniref:DUF3800 domain-containing protein n=1 Tax=Streptomyces platensis TaxID=58346 RepID=UPI0036CB3282